jgi:ASC-1-like (ASCH) protein
MDVCDPWYEHLRTGAKPVEGRKASPTWVSIREGDTIAIRSGTSQFCATVTGVAEYRSTAATAVAGLACLRAFLEAETLARALPGVRTIDDGIKTYLQWFTAEDIGRYGMLGIQVTTATRP